MAIALAAVMLRRKIQVAVAGMMQYGPVYEGQLVGDGPAACLPVAAYTTRILRGRTPTDVAARTPCCSGFRRGSGAIHYYFRPVVTIATLPFLKFADSAFVNSVDLNKNGN